MTASVSSSLSFAGLQDQFLQVVETRVQNSLLVALLGTNQADDQLSRLRNDQAFELGATPAIVPGNN